MARSAEGSLLTQQHRRVQLAIRAAALADLTRLWRAVDPLNLAATIRPFAGAGAVIVRARHRDSAATASRYYREFRRIEGETGSIAIVAADPPSSDVVGGLLRGAALAGIIHARRRGFSPQAAARNGLVRVAGSASNLVLLGGRRVILTAVAADPQAQRWQRVTAADPCPFCMMLAARGPVFRGEDTAGFQAHDHCACVAEPAFEGSELPEASQRFREMWDQAQREARESGELNRGTANDDLNAFRRFVAARDQA